MHFYRFMTPVFICASIFKGWRVKKKNRRSPSQILNKGDNSSLEGKDNSEADKSPETPDLDVTSGLLEGIYKEKENIVLV